MVKSCSQIYDTMNKYRKYNYRERERERNGVRWRPHFTGVCSLQRYTLLVYEQRCEQACRKYGVISQFMNKLMDTPNSNQAIPPGTGSICHMNVESNWGLRAPTCEVSCIVARIPILPAPIRSLLFKLKGHWHTRWWKQQKFLSIGPAR